jgi:signal transduction histidine kinase
MGAVSLISFSRGYSRDDLALSTELAHRLALALDNAQLYDEARRAVQVRDDVLAIVSHDLRNPLSTILTSTERLLTRSSDDARQSLERCQRAAQRMTRMISDLVDAASLETGTLSLDRREHDVGRVVQDALDLLQPLAEARGISLAAAGAIDLYALCDRERVVQVLSNLVGNAIKFSPPGSDVRISAAPWGEMVRVSVSDTGPGIAAELLAHIFDRYWHTDTSDNRHGAGLGLYIAKGIVEGHGGRIWVDSMLRHGSTFHFTLPAPSAKVLHVAH